MKDEKKNVPVEKPKKAEKAPKKTKKAPGIFARKYTQKRLEKKVYSRIFVKEDLVYVKSLFVEQEDKKGRKFYALPKDMRFTKKEAKRLSVLSKDVKSQKGRVKLAALLITVALIAAAGIFLSLFKNVLVKKAVKSGCEAAFGAVCDIGDVDFRPLDGYLSITDLEIADKSNPWTNLIQIGRITSDFNLTMLLQGKFIVEEMSVTGIESGTARKIDGTLPVKEKKQKEKKEKKAVEPEEPSEPSKLSLKTAEITAQLTDSFNSAVDDLFAQYDPESIIDGLYSQLSLPGMSNEAIGMGTALAVSIQDEVTELQKAAEDVKKSFDSVMALDYQAALKNPLLAKEMYETVSDTYSAAVSAYDEAQTAKRSFVSAGASVKELSASLTSAFDADSSFIRNQVSDLKGITAGDCFSFLSDTAADFAKATLGDAWGYVETALDYIQNMKKDDTPAKEGKKPGERLPGQTITYREYNEPSFWIKHLEGSGPKLQFTAVNVSSDEEAAGGPAILDFNGHDMGFAMGSDSGSAPGMKGSAAFDLSATIHDTGSYALTGDLDLSPFTLHAGAFSPEAASDIVNSVFARFDSVSGGFTAVSEKRGQLDFSFETDLGSAISAAIKDEWNAQIENIKETVLAEAQDRLKGYVDDAIESLTGYTDYESLVNEYSGLIESYRNQIEEKKNELSGYINGAADAVKAEADRLKAEAEEAAKKAAEAAAEEAAKKAAEAAANAFKKFW